MLLVVEKLNVELGDLTEVGKMTTRIEWLGQPVFEVTYTPAQVLDRPQQRQVLLFGQQFHHALLEQAASAH